MTTPRPFFNLRDTFIWVCDNRDKDGKDKECKSIYIFWPINQVPFPSPPKGFLSLWSFITTV